MATHACSATVSTAYLRSDLSEFGPVMLLTRRKAERQRVLIGWKHQIDTAEARNKDRIWCWVSAHNYLQIFDETFNRSEDPGVVRFCGVANFTMVRMFHPWFAIQAYRTGVREEGDEGSDGGQDEEIVHTYLRAPKDMVWPDKRWCRYRYKKAVRAWREARGLPVDDEDEPDQDDGGNDGGNDEDGNEDEDEDKNDADEEDAGSNRSRASSNDSNDSNNSNGSDESSSGHTSDHARANSSDGSIRPNNVIRKVRPRRFSDSNTNSKNDDNLSDNDSECGPSFKRSRTGTRESTPISTRDQIHHSDIDLQQDGISNDNVNAEHENDNDNDNAQIYNVDANTSLTILTDPVSQSNRSTTDEDDKSNITIKNEEAEKDNDINPGPSTSTVEVKAESEISSCEDGLFIPEITTTTENEEKGLVDDIKLEPDWEVCYLGRRPSNSVRSAFSPLVVYDGFGTNDDPIDLD